MIYLVKPSARWLVKTRLPPLGDEISLIKKTFIIFIPVSLLFIYFNSFMRLMSIKSILGIIVGISLVVMIGAMNLIQHDAEAVRARVDGIIASAPVVVSGDNVYVAWWTNKTANQNEEVMFRASTDGGATFGDKINLSNTTDADSERVEIAAEGADVAVTWWETNQTSDTPVARLSSDGGQTFGPMLRLATNGTIDSTEEGGGKTVEVVEEAVGGAEVAE
jgi:hypothetical protein